MHNKPLTVAMDNVHASRLGQIAKEVGTQSNGIGDSIDRGLILRRRLEEEGFHLVLIELGETDTCRRRR